MGTIVTFYSFKGGTGRSMALANVAVLLTRWGYKTLIVDWDLEAPGLEYFFRPFFKDSTQISSKPGVIELLTDSGAKLKADSLLEHWQKALVEIQLPDNRTLALLTAGKRTDDYFQRVAGLNVESFYKDQGGGKFIERLRQEWKDSFDFIMIDSRTGVTDIGGICTVQLPDSVVLLFTPTDQALEGICRIAENIQAAQLDMPLDRRALVQIPVASRIDVQQEFILLQEWMQKAAQMLAPVFRDWLPRNVEPLRMLEATKLPYKPFFSYGERLAVIEQGTTDSTGLGFAYENLAALIARELEDSRLLVEQRDLFVQLAQQKREKRHQRIFLCYSHKDAKWRDGIVTHLNALSSETVVDVWVDSAIAPGEKWIAEIDRAIQQARVAVVLVSPALLGSPNITDIELPTLLRRNAAGGVRIVPVIAEPCAWQQVDWLAPLQVLPRGGKPLSLLSRPETEMELAAIAAEVGRILSEDETLKIWGAESGTELATLRGHSDRVWACAYSPDGQRIVSASEDETLKIWDADSLEEMATLTGHRDYVNACVYSPDGKRIVSASQDRTLKIWDAESGLELATLTGHSYAVWACAYSPDGRRIVSASKDGTLKIWDAESGAQLAALAGHSSKVSACAYSPDGRRIVSASDDGRLKLWDAESGAELATLVGHKGELPPMSHVTACAYSPDGKRIVSASRDGTLKIWNAESGEKLATLVGHTDDVNACAYSPDGSRIVSASGDKTLKIWDAVSGAELATLVGHKDDVNGCAYSPDGRRIVSASEDETLKIWDAESGT
jgi:WD40 repeat protein/cellulose biosynthesis protein BcsQ